jgi:uncharacterized protein YndB with AHSA1/START domain
MRDDIDEDRIEKVVDLAAPVSRVWQALSDYHEFGEWFRVELDGPFEPGEVSTGKMTFPDSEGLPWPVLVDRMEPERLFSFRWNLEEAADAANQQTMLVEFRLEETAVGTRLTITESGFSAIPESRRIEMLRQCDWGWDVQSRNIAVYIASGS